MFRLASNTVVCTEPLWLTPYTLHTVLSHVPCAILCPDPHETRAAGFFEGRRIPFPGPGLKDLQQSGRCLVYGNPVPSPHQWIPLTWMADRDVYVLSWSPLCISVLPLDLSPRREFIKWFFCVDLRSVATRSCGCTDATSYGGRNS